MNQTKIKHRCYFASTWLFLWMAYLALAAAVGDWGYKYATVFLVAAGCALWLRESFRLSALLYEARKLEAAKQQIEANFKCGVCGSNQP